MTNQVKHTATPKIVGVREFNQEHDRRYLEKVANFDHTKGGFPFRPMYVFQTPEGKDRERGFVLIEREGSYRFFFKRKDVEEALKQAEGK